MQGPISPKKIVRSLGMQEFVFGIGCLGGEIL